MDGVVITGGEPTIQSDLFEFIEKIKELDLLVKLDTNGTRPDVVQDLISRGLVDYIGMDLKHVWGKYADITHAPRMKDNTNPQKHLLSCKSLVFCTNSIPPRFLAHTAKMIFLLWQDISKTVRYITFKTLITKQYFDLARIVHKLQIRFPYLSIKLR